jgi:hypothetical protein
MESFKMFFTFRQHKASGFYVLSPFIGHFVIIEAEDHYDAACRAEIIGLYFDGVAFGIDKNIDRWDLIYSGDGCPTPTIDGVLLDKYQSFDKKIVVIYNIKNERSVIVKQRSN